MKILGIYRHPMFSNNAIEADRLILEESIAELKRTFKAAPLVIDFVEEPEINASKLNYDLILTMAQSEEALKKLENVPSQFICNSSTAIRNCYRLAMSNALIKMNVGYVPFHVVKTTEQAPADLNPSHSYWVKRSDFHAISDEDVSLVENIAEMPAVLARFQARGVKEVIIQRHIHGDIYKFYGVRDRFFKPIKVRDFLKQTVTPNFDILEPKVIQAAEALQLKVFGGDCVLDEAGNFQLIDLNDWPSFRICRPEAAKAIASLAADHLAQVLTLSHPQKELAVTGL